jgi:hypothetical protein
VGVDGPAFGLRLCEKRAARRCKELPAIEGVADWFRVAGRLCRCDWLGLLVFWR